MTTSWILDGQQAGAALGGGALEPTLVLQMNANGPVSFTNATSTSTYLYTGTTPPVTATKTFAGFGKFTPSLISDPDNIWDDTSKEFTVPESGRYLIAFCSFFHNASLTANGRGNKGRPGALDKTGYGLLIKRPPSGEFVQYFIAHVLDGIGNNQSEMLLRPATAIVELEVGDVVRFGLGVYGTTHGGPNPNTIWQTSILCAHVLLLDPVRLFPNRTEQTPLLSRFSLNRHHGIVQAVGAENFCGNFCF